jgi:hypothetical protein
MSALNLEIKSKLDELSNALLSAHPQMPTLLRDIRTTLKNFSEQVTLMTEEEINIVVRGLEKQTNSHVAAATVKPSAAKKAALKNVTSDDLGFD